MLASAILIALATASQPFSYMDELRAQEKAFAEAAQPGNERIFAAQMLAFAQANVDATQKPGITYFSANPESQRAAAGDAARAREILEQYEPREALAAIVQAARDRQIVIINEAHFTPRHRAFSTLLALELRKLGFEYLAAETLDNRGPDPAARLRARGYPLTQDGWYSKEPVFGDFLRRSLAAGYQPVAYEFTAFDAAYQRLDVVEQQILREETQAQNIVDRVLKKNPRARILIHVGHGHVRKGRTDFLGREISMMAESLRQRSAIDPLCIEQTRSVMPELVEEDRPLTTRVMKSFDGESFVLARRAGAGYWNTGDVDIQVWHRPESLRGGRPDWLAMGNYRQPRAIDSELLPRTGRRLVQAFVASEPADAVPMDQVLVTAGETPPVWMLPKGEYRFVIQD